MLEAAKVDGASPWQSFWQITFPLMLPVSVTAVILRIIFELKLADIVINVTSGGPGGATDTVSSFIYREYRDRSNVGYGTMLAEVYLVIIIIFVTACCSKFVGACRMSIDRGAGASRPISATAARRQRRTRQVLIYGALLFWAFVSLFPIYWTMTTSFKVAVDVTQGHLIPWVDFQPDWKGWRSLGLSPDTIFETSTVREEFLLRFENSILTSVGASLLAVIIGSLAAYGLSRFQYKFGPWRNKDISFFFLSQLILPPVVLAMPFLVLYKELALLDTQHRADPGLHADGAADRHLDHARPVRHDPDRARGGGAGRRLRASGARSCASCCRSRSPAWWPPSSSLSCCAGTSISLPRC